MIEITVICSDDEKKINHKFLVHSEGMILSHDDMTLTECVNKAKKSFGGEPSDILIKFKYTW